MRGVDPDCLRDFGANAIDGAVQAFAQWSGKNTGRDCDAAQIRHLMRFHHQFLTAVLPCRCPQYEMKGVFRIDCQSRHLRSLYALVLGDNACFRAIAVQAQASQVGGGEFDLVPFEHDGCLGGISAADDRRGRGGTAIGVEDAGLEGGEGLLGGYFGLGVAGYCYVDYGAGCDGGGKEDGGEFDLRAWTLDLAVSFAQLG